MKIRLKWHLKPQQGDTLIEVLLSIAIISLVLAVSYAISTRALQQGVQAREHTEAMYLLQGQVETLKFREQNSTEAIFKAFEDTANNNFCLDTAANSSADANWGPVVNTQPNSLQQQSSTASGYAATCIKNGKYYINITIPAGYFPLTGIHPTYLFTVSWYRIGGGDQIDQSKIFYRF